jgi:hypothetical protein
MLIIKRSVTALVVVISAIATTAPAYASEVEVSPANAEYGQASLLTTRPIMINTNAGNFVYSTSKLNQVVNSILEEGDRESPSINPLNLFKSPGPTLKRFFQQEPNQTPQPIEPLDFFQVPPLDSGVSVKVTHF